MRSWPRCEHRCGKTPGARAPMGHGAAGPQGGWGQYVAREPAVGIKSFCPPGKGDPAVPLEALAMPGEADDTQLNSRLPPAAASRTRVGSLGRISPYPHRGVGEVLVGTSAPQPAFPLQNELRVDPQGLQGGVSEHAAPREALLPPDSPQPVPGGGHLPRTGEEHVCGRSLSQQRQHTAANGCVEDGCESGELPRPAEFPLAGGHRVKWWGWIFRRRQNILWPINTGGVAR